MDVKDLQNDATLGERSNDGSKYASSGVTLPYSRNKSYQDVSSVSLGKVDAQTTRPCAVIGPDRVQPLPVSNDTVKKSAYDAWYADSVYRHPPEYPHKMTNYNTPIRNISPRQTFQENMQRIMVPPTYNSVKSNEEHHFSMDKNISLTKNTKPNIPLETKYCEVPYSGNLTSSEQKSVRNIEQCASNVNPVLTRSAPQGWPSHVRPSRPYGAAELYQYPDYNNCAGPRPVPISRSHRLTHEDSSHVYPDPYSHDGNIRFKPYTTVKDRYPTRYEFISNYPSPFHPPSAFPTHKYDMQKSIPQPYAYPQVPIKYLDSRPDPLLEGYPRPAQQSNYNLPFHNQMIHSAYGSVLGNCIQNKFPCPPEGPVKSVAPNKPPYDANKMYAEYENARSKGFPVSENYYFNEMQRPPHHIKSQVMPNYAANMHGIPPHPYYRKDSSTLKNYDYMHHFRNIDPSMLTHSRIPSQFSPNAITLAPSDTNLSMDPTQIQGNAQEDCGYVSQSPTVSVRSMDYINRPTNEFYRRYDSRYGPNIRPPPMMGKPDQNTNSNSKDKKGIDVRQFLQMWNEVDDENAENSTKEVVAQIHPNEVNKAPNQYETIKSQDQLYVLGLVNVPSEELGKYEHIQKVSKLPENIKGYNSIELLNQFEEVIESSNVNNFKTKPSNSRDVTYPMSLKNSGSHHSLGLLPRPVSPLDVEAKISQSVIHKEVGCNFEIKPCSPKMLNVEAATPIQNLLSERAIEKVSNPITISPPLLHEGILNHPEQIKSPNENLKNSSCKMTNTQFNNNDSVRPNYSLQDLESNSGVCLASLPRLDNDIELNFPEVNQQFINANKGESVITATKDLPSLINLDPIENVSSKTTETDLREQPDASYEFPSIADSEREFSKLSKYRKHKKYGPDSVTQNMRTDSVIIKNPENPKMYEQSKDVVSVESALAQNIIIQNKDNLIDKADTDTEFSNKLDYAEIDTQMDIAIDFSLNKNDNNNSVSNAIDYYIGNQTFNLPSKINKTNHRSKITKHETRDLLKEQKDDNENRSNPNPVSEAETSMKDTSYASSVSEIKKSGIAINKQFQNSGVDKNIDEMRTLTKSPSKAYEDNEDASTSKFQSNKKIDEMRTMTISPSKTSKDNKNLSTLKFPSSRHSISKPNKYVTESQQRYNKNNEDNEKDTHSSNNIHDHKRNENREPDIDLQFEPKDHLDSSQLRDDNTIAMISHLDEYGQNNTNENNFEFFSDSDDGNTDASDKDESDNLQEKSCVIKEENKTDKIEIIPNTKNDKNETDKIKGKLHIKENYKNEIVNKNNETKCVETIQISVNSPLKDSNLENSLQNCKTFEHDDILKDTDSKQFFGSEETFVESIKQLQSSVTLPSKDATNNNSLDSCETSGNDADEVLETSDAKQSSINETLPKSYEQGQTNMTLLLENERLKSVLKFSEFPENNKAEIPVESDAKNISGSGKTVESTKNMEMDAKENKKSNAIKTESEKNNVKSTGNTYVQISTTPPFEIVDHENTLKVLETFENQTDELSTITNAQQNITNESLNKSTVEEETNVSLEDANRKFSVKKNVSFVNNINEKPVESVAKSIKDEKAIIEPIEDMEINTDGISRKFDANKIVQNEKSVLESTENMHVENLHKSTTLPLEIPLNCSPLNKYESFENNTDEILNESDAKLISASKHSESTNNKNADKLQMSASIKSESATQENLLKDSVNEDKIDQNHEMIEVVTECYKDSEVSCRDSGFSEVASMIVDSALENSQNINIPLIQNQDSNQTKPFLKKSNNIPLYSADDADQIPLFENSKTSIKSAINFNESSNESPHCNPDISRDENKLYGSDPSDYSNSNTVVSNVSDENLVFESDNIFKDQESSDVKPGDKEIETQKYSDKNIYERKENFGSCQLKKELFSPFIQKLINYHVDPEDKIHETGVNVEVSTNHYPNIEVQDLKVRDHIVDGNTLETFTEITFDDNEHRSKIVNISLGGPILESMYKNTYINDESRTDSSVVGNDAKELIEINEIVSSKTDLCIEIDSGEYFNAASANKHSNEDIFTETTLINNPILDEKTEYTEIPEFDDNDNSKNDVSITDDDSYHIEYQVVNDNVTEPITMPGTHTEGKLFSSNKVNFDCKTVETSKDLLGKSPGTDRNILDTNRPRLKRSISDSALDSLKDSSDAFYSGWQPKRPKRKFHNILESDIILESNRRKSISSVYNEQNVSFCILIDNDCIITEEESEEQDEVCFTEISEGCLTDLQASVNEYENTVSPQPLDCSGETNHEYSELQEGDEKSFEESWVDDVGCVETVVSDVAEDITISASSSPERIHSPENEESGIFINSEHTDKVKHIYGDKMCNDDIMFLETLYRTPQMNVNKIINRESQISDECIQYYNKDSLEKVLSESNNYDDPCSDLEPLASDTNFLNQSDNVECKNMQLEDQLNTVNISPTRELFSMCESENEKNDGSKENLVITPDKTQDDTVHSCESSIDNVFSYNQKDDYTSYTSSTSPEVSSTTSEERNSAILLKITNYKGSRISQINSFEQETKSISCKFTELSDYSSSQNFKSNRPLITKAAQKYIPPLKETFGDLKIRLPLPQHSLLRLKQLKLLKEDSKPNKYNIKSKPEIPKKPKPKFEDVLKSIDEMQFKRHKEKSKKTKKSIPKVVIKKNENGSHYASTANREPFNPDLTGRKWQPWVFLEKNNFIDKMALRNKRKAIFNYRKNTYVLAEKFRKYKSIGNAKFIISQPNLHNSSIGHLKCTIRLKHTY